MPGGRFLMGSSGMLKIAAANETEFWGPVGDWYALRTIPDYKADSRAHGRSPSVVESAAFVLRAQTEADLEAARWELLAWEDPRERSKFKPFWIDEKMLIAVVVEPGGPVGMMARAIGMSVSGLRLLDAALVLKVKRGRRAEQIRVLEGDSFDMERTALQLRYPLSLAHRVTLQGVRLHVAPSGPAVLTAPHHRGKSMTPLPSTPQSSLFVPSRTLASS